MSPLRSRRFIGLLAALLWCAASPAATPTAEVVLPGTGLRMRVSRLLSPSPLPPPRIQAYRKSDLVPLFTPAEWWRFRQTAGCWRGSSGDVVIGEILLPELRTQERFAAEDDLEKTYAASADLEREWGEDRLKAWVGNFFDGEVTSVLPWKGGRGTTGSVCRLAGRDGGSFEVYLIWPVNDPGRRIALRADAHREAVDSVEFIQPERDLSARQLRVGGYLGDRRSQVSAAYQASRRRVLETIRNYRDWWYLETDCYIFISNQEDKRGMMRIRRELEKARGIFLEYFPLKGEENAVSVIRIFNTRDEYLAYMGESFKWSGGIWMPAARELVISPLEGNAPEKAQAGVIRQVVFHEGFHQYLYYASGGADAALWFNEGTAQYFEGLEFKGTRPGVVLDDGKAAQLRKAVLSGGIALSELLAADRERFYGDARKRDTYYAVSQALMHYLYKGAVLEGRTAYARIPFRYYDALLESRDGAAATRIALEGIDLAQLEKDFAAFWKNDQKLRRSLRYTPSPGKRTK